MKVKQSGLYNYENEHDSCGIGFVAHIKGNKSHNIVQNGLQVLMNMTHRGAEGADNKTGDGAGITIQLPHEFFLDIGIELLNYGMYGSGLIFLPQNASEADFCRNKLEQIVQEEGLNIIQWRDVPVNNSSLGEIALSSEPLMKQVFIGGRLEQDDLERKLYIIRKRTENLIQASELSQKHFFYVNSLSSKIFIYKGLFTPSQLRGYYLDLQNEKLKSAIALVHSRFSTNTFPTWDLAQPFRMLAHNGEINTIKGNRLWMHARESLLRSELFEDNLSKIFPIIEPGKSDSASLDNVLEFLVQTGRSIPHALSMLVPEAWNDKNPIPASLKSFYEYHSTFMEPWDGPAALLFCDGRYIGGTLDRNGLRPSRYLITHDDLIVMGSETGVMSFKDSNIKEKGRLRPGKILLVDTQLGIIIPNEEIKAELARINPYSNWLKENRLELKDIKVKQRVSPDLHDKYDLFLKVFGYTKEDIEYSIRTMAQTGKEPVSSMGNDTPMAIFSEKPQRMFNYFRQLFAQVTNPAIDPIREGLVMSLTNYIGAVQKNLLDETSGNCHLIKFKSPIISNTDLQKIRDLHHESFSNITLSILYEVEMTGKGLYSALENLCRSAEEAVSEGAHFIILSDKRITERLTPIPSLLAVSAVHHHLINVKKRMQVGLIVETGEVREVTHYALLLGYGASVINPYMSHAVVHQLVKKGKLSLSYQQARNNYNNAIDNGVLKIMSKMGISTLRSYHGAQLFEALGLDSELTEKYFQGTPSRIGGLGLEELANEQEEFHKEAFDSTQYSAEEKNQGIYTYRKNGEFHAWNPETIGLLQWSTSNNDYAKFKAYSSLVNEQTKQPVFIRGMLDFKTNAIDIDEVEPITEITKRFVTGAMSFGSISAEAHEAIAIAMNKIGGRSNTGEGGEDPSRFIPAENGESKRSAIKQVASGRFGVNTRYLINADEIQIKVSQGAKPGEGGQLPGNKVDKIIARIRNSVPGITLISPPPHHDIYSIEDLAQLIFDLKNVNPLAKISVKLVAESGVGTVAAGVAKAHADIIVISGTEGGTGASPASSIKYAGVPWEMGLAEAHQTLTINQLRNRVKLQTDGQIKTGQDMVIAGLLGAEEFGISTAGLIVLGCVMMRKCHLNTCPTGVATQEKHLRKRFIGKSEYLINYFQFLAEEVREIMAEIGIRKFDDLVGRVDLLTQNTQWDNYKVNKIDLSLILTNSQNNPDFNNKNKTGKKEEPSLLDHELIKLADKALLTEHKVWISQNIKNTDRSVGAMLSGEVVRRYSSKELPKNTINCNFYGSAGQSFAAFLVSGISFRLEGDANDYLGKGLSGGKIIIVPPADASFKADKNIIVGNTVLYGATSGHLYVNGIAGERFCVRNSGAYAVVEGVGDHGCEYMTGGRVVVLGETGRNFAAGMSGGIAYVLDETGNFDYFCNHSLVELSVLQDNDDIEELQGLIHKHWLHTNSEKAETVLVNWEKYRKQFIRVLPLEYKKIMNERKLQEVNMKLQKANYDPNFAE